MAKPAPSKLTILLAGNPNSGKTSLFNWMAGAHQHMGNYPGVTVEKKSSMFVRDGVEIELTATEFELLRFIMRNQRRVVSKAQILDRVWNYDFGGQANVVELYISYLRKKIDADREPMIHTMRGAGYVLRPAGA